MKKVLITGIGRGIGEALAKKFLQEDWAVVGTSTSGKVDFHRENLSVLQLDLSSAASISSCAAAIAAHGPIDILINNAGVLLDEDETTLDAELLRKTLEVNLIGTAAFTEKVLTSIASSGHLIFISSTAGSLALMNQSHYPLHYPAYKISKAALNMYMRTLALRLSDGPIVSAVHPGWVRTQMGGEEADISPEEAAEGVYQFALSTPETGGFWFKGERLAW
jgi:NAD(P)-dependent dehydrogenase (short-subunit alcohol dehydrogenase family)